MAIPDMVSLTQTRKKLRAEFAKAIIGWNESDITDDSNLFKKPADRHAVPSALGFGLDDPGVEEIREIMRAAAKVLLGQKMIREQQMPSK